MRHTLALRLAALASCTITVHGAANSAQCVSGPLAMPVSLLKTYGPAQAYCSQQHPVTTTTITSCASPTIAPTRKERRNASKPTNNDPNDSNASDDQAQAFTKLQQASPTTQQAVCECISAAPSAVTITASCSSNQYCDPSGTCKPSRNCRNPARCESQSYCLEAAAGACFCHPDTDDSTQGYCLSGGPPDRGCPDVYEDCSSNSNCSGAKVCIYACCREQPFCIDVNEYDPHTPNHASTKMLFRRSTNDERPALNPQ